MTEQSQIAISFAELTCISFECTKCHAEMALELTNEQHRGIAIRDEKARMKCLFCGAQFDAYLHDAFSNLFRWYDLAKKSGHNIIFRIKRAEEEGDG